MLWYIWQTEPTESVFFNGGSRKQELKYHSSMLPHAGEKSRIYREVCQLGEALNKLQTVKGTTVRQAPLAMIFDYDSWWAYENGLLTREFDYRGEFFHWYQSALEAGITADVVGKNADWEKYEAVMFPVTLLVDKDRRICRC